jgi:hypothetical protein
VKHQVLGFLKKDLFMKYKDKIDQWDLEGGKGFWRGGMEGFS